MRLAASSPAPPERLAAFRIVLGGFVTAYLLIRFGVFAELGGRSPDRFDPVGIFRVIDAPLAGSLNLVVLALTIVLCVLFAVGWRFRLTGPLCAAALLIVLTHRSSWGQLLHFENLMVLHVAVVACSPAVDAWSMDARRADATRPVWRGDDRYGFPLLVAAVIVATTYVIAGVAKLRYGGIKWVVGDTLRNHIAYSAARLELLGASASPIASAVVDIAWIWPPIAALAVAIELSAPVALFGGKLRAGWVIAAWCMHVGIYATMLVGFPSPLFLVAFAPLFELERGAQRLGGVVNGRRLRWRG